MVLNQNQLCLKKLMIYLESSRPELELFGNYLIYLISRQANGKITIIFKENGSMSSIVKQVQQEEQYLCSDINDDMAEVMVELKKYMGGTKLEQGYMLPRYGLLSLKAAITPMYVYDHPSLEKITNTAFTDGVHIFVCAKFLRKLVEEEENSKNTEFGCEPLLMHEIMHMLLGHTHRLRMFPKDIANKAEDLVINSKLQLGFPTMKWTKTISELGLGFKASEAEKYAVLSEETVARMLMADEDKTKKKSDSKGDGKGQGQGQGQKGQKGQQGQNGKGDPSSGEGGGEGGEEEWSDMHTVTLQELIETLQEAGLDNVLEKLELPTADCVEEIAKIEENTLLKDIECIEKAAAQKAALGGKYPGGHIVDAAAERIKGLTDGKLEWKLGLREWILGGGMRFKHFEDEADQIYYLDASEMGLSDQIYLGSPVPHSPEEVVLCLIDTSGSVDQKMLRAFISEVLTLKKGVSGVSDTASQVILLSADTVLRGQAVEIDDSNVDELMDSGVNVFGRGGTDLAGSLDMAMNLELIKTKKIASVVYLTDLCDTPPPMSRYEKYLEKGIKFAFVTLPNTYSEEFAKAVKDYARVYAIEDGATVDLSEEALSQPVNTRGTKLR